MNLRVLDEDLYSDELARGFGPRRPGDAGLDLRAARAIKVGQELVVIPLGIAFELPPDHVGWITGRSSLSTTYGVVVHDGKIDSGYRGEVHCLLQSPNRDVLISRGERICQFIAVKITQPTEWRIVGELTETERSIMGLGSTGRV